MTNQTPKLTREMVEDAIAKGITSTDIAKMAGCSQNTVKRFAKKIGLVDSLIKPRGGTTTLEMLTMAIENGWSIVEAQENLKVSRKSLRFAEQRHGMKLRRIHGAVKEAPKPRANVITREMIDHCVTKKWTAQQGADHFGFKYKPMRDAATRFGVKLRKAEKQTDAAVSLDQPKPKIFDREFCLDHLRAEITKRRNFEDAYRESIMALCPSASRIARLPQEKVFGRSPTTDAVANALARGIVTVYAIAAAVECDPKKVSNVLLQMLEDGEVTNRRDGRLSLWALASQDVATDAKSTSRASTVPSRQGRVSGGVILGARA